MRAIRPGRARGVVGMRSRASGVARPPDVNKRTKKRAQAKRAAAAFRRATPVAQGAQPYHVTRAGTRASRAAPGRAGVRPDQSQRPRLIKSSNPGLLRRNAAFTTRVTAPIRDFSV
jgi:hypothetical protein